tara:strand:+ start:97 stop:330 length:234 start_codon:yes stop_codon:yes gene_type:complete
MKNNTLKKTWVIFPAYATDKAPHIMNKTIAIEILLFKTLNNIEVSSPEIKIYSKENELIKLKESSRNVLTSSVSVTG